jgi:hypothetical protein
MGEVSHLLWIFGPVAVVFAAGLVILLRIARRRRQISTRLRRAPKGHVKGLRLRQIGLGLILSEAWGAYTDSLTTGTPKAKLRAMLGGDWRITDSESARDTLRSLLDLGHRAVLDPTLRVYAITPRESWNAALAAANLPVAEFRTALEGLDAVVHRLSATGLITSADLKNSIGAWDFGRVVAIARAAYDCGYIGETEAWALIGEADARARRIYKSWNDFAASYLIGRALWAGHRGTDVTMAFAEIAETLKTDPASPWLKAR